MKTDDLVLSVSPQQITFSAVAVGESDTVDVTLTHIGESGTIQLEKVTLETESTDFALEPPAATSLGVGESTKLSVTYSPSDAIEDSGSVQIRTNIPHPDGTGSLTVVIPITTLAQGVNLIAVPSPLDFGAVQSGKTVTESVTVQNLGSLEANITSITIKSGATEDFEVATTPDLPHGLTPDGSFDVEVSYRPTGIGEDFATLAIDYEQDGEPGMLEVTLRGTEVSARLVASPNPVDFGKRATGETHETSIYLANQGELPLEITGVSVEPTSDWGDTVGVGDFPAEGVTLDKGAVPFTLTVTFSPPSDMAVLTLPIASVRILSNDPAGGGVLDVPVFGRPDAPSLQVNPPDFVDFGFVAQNLSTKRTVSLYNAGSTKLEVYAITLTDGEGANADEFELVTDDQWGPTATTPSQGELAPGQSRVLQLLFTNKGDPSGIAWAKLTIESNDGQTATWEVNLKAQRAGAPTCELEFAPPTLDFGIVPRGFTKTMTIQLVNKGSGNCSFHSALTNGCSSWLGMLGTSCEDPNNTVQLGGTSEYYRIVSNPPAVQEGIKPGMSYPIEVMFTPPESAPIMGDMQTDYGGLLAVRYVDPNTPGTDLQLMPEAQTGPLGTSYTANLHAKSGLAELSVFPQELGFGLTTIGCASQTLTVNAYNIGTAPLDITDWQLVSCSPEFKVKSYPPMPCDGNGECKAVLDPGEGVEFQVVYVPQDESEDACSLALYTNAADTPAAVVPLSGAGTYETEQIDEYIQTSGQDVDVLFVVDNSGSMGEEQGNLATNFKNFTQEAQTWQNSYHVGIITCDQDDGGVLEGDPRYVTPGNWQQFTTNVKVGTNGSGTEQGMMTAQMALSLPNTADSSVACTSDTDCASTGEGCYDGFCGGPNRGFVRKESTLEVVFVSDEEDQSPADLNFYINFFKNIKGFYNANLFHAHAIVGPPGGCSTSQGDAVPGLRYIDLANATGGNVASICEPDFAQALKGIGEIAFGLRVQFFLTRAAVPESIEVKIEGTPCAASAGGTVNWSYDDPSNAVIFNENGGCMPQPGDHIWIHYEAICFLE